MGSRPGLTCCGMAISGVAGAATVGPTTRGATGTGTTTTPCRASRRAGDAWAAAGSDAVQTVAAIMARGSDAATKRTVDIDVSLTMQTTKTIGDREARWPPDPLLYDATMACATIERPGQAVPAGPSTAGSAAACGRSAAAADGLPAPRRECRFLRTISRPAPSTASDTAAKA